MQREIERWAEYWMSPPWGVKKPAVSLDGLRVVNRKVVSEFAVGPRVNCRISGNLVNHSGQVVAKITWLESGLDVWAVSILATF